MDYLIVKTLAKAGIFNQKNKDNLTARINKKGKDDVVTEGDIQIGDLIIKGLLDQKRNVVVESEEHGKQSNFQGDKREDVYYAIDDIDGSNNLRVGRGYLPYASMVVSFEKDNGSGDEPYKYSDYKEAACLDHLNQRIYYTQKGLGSVQIYDFDLNFLDEFKGRTQEDENLALTLSTDIVSSNRGGNVGYAASKKDDLPKNIVFPDRLSLVKLKYALCDSASSVEEYGMVGIGVGDGYVSSGKKQHELPLLYAFASETGLEMTDFEGKSYANKEYDFNGTGAEVICATPEVRKNIQDLIEQQVKTNQKINTIFEAACAAKGIGYHKQDGIDR